MLKYLDAGALGHFVGFLDFLMKDAQNISSDWLKEPAKGLPILYHFIIGPFDRGKGKQTEIV